MSNFSDRLKLIRKERNLSQQELADILGTTKQVISRYETEQRTPKITVANEYAAKLGVSLTFLLGDDEQTNEPPTTDPKEQWRKALEALFNKPVSREQAERLYQGMTLLMESSEDS